MADCKQCGTVFEITADDLSFYDQVSPVFEGRKYQIPPPTLCPDCRQIRRMCERNARNLYWRKCDFTGEDILSQHHSDCPFPVYSTKIWWSDEWDGIEYGRSFDFSRPFFEQFKELKQVVPHQARFVIEATLENSDYTNCTGYLKNCYLISECDHDEECYYSMRLYDSKQLVDCFNCHDCELGYECIDCIGCQRVLFSQDCQNCHDSMFLSNCLGCNDCIGCINQRHKKFMIFNEQFTEEEYRKRKSELHLNEISGMQKLRRECNTFFTKQPHKCVQADHNENCTGDHIFNSKNSNACMDCKDLEDCKYCSCVSMGVKSSMDYTFWGDKAELMYECSGCGDNVFNLKFCTTCTTNLSDCMYCDQCTSLDNCFGCVGLKKKKYCILNKQYSKEEYEKLVPKIIEHMSNNGEFGKFFPKDLCPFAYNETRAMEHFSLSKEDVLNRGFRWRDEKDEPPKVEKIIKANQLPDLISGVPDDILNWAIECEETKRPFRIIKQELEFYRKMNIPVPHLHPDERHKRRMQLRNPRKLCTRQCDKCKKEIQTTYSPERSEVVYCEECYLKEVY
jgi:hypothetical protein